MAFLQAVGILFSCILGIASVSGSMLHAGEAFGMTLRQREILLELNNYPSPWPHVSSAGWMLKPWEVTQSLNGIITLPGGNENAAECFSRLEELYPGEKAALEQGNPESMGVNELIRAADMGKCQLSPDYYPELVSTAARQPDLVVLNSYLEALLQKADNNTKAGRYSEAERCYRAALVCGWHLLQDKSSCLVYASGLLFLIKGSQGYAPFLLDTGNREKAMAVSTFAQTCGAILRAFTWKTQVALSEVNAFACLPAAIHIATGDSEAFWRKEAVIRLATLRYGVVREDESSVERNPLFEQAADEALVIVVRSDPDPSVRRLAIWAALNVTPNNYPMLQHRFP